MMMMKLARRVSIIGACALFAIGQPASAALLTATVSGTVSALANGSGAFDIGVFGAGYQSLIGTSFTATYVFELDDAAFRATVPSVFSPAIVAAGGAWSPIPSAGFGQAALTIGGRTISFVGRAFGVVSAGTGERTFNVGDFSTSELGFAVSANLFDPTRSFPATLESAGTWTGSFDAAADASSETPSGFYINYFDGRLAGGALTPTTLTIAISAVPEAPSWAMMIIGFGTIAAGLRRTRRRPLTT